MNNFTKWRWLMPGLLLLLLSSCSKHDGRLTSGGPVIKLGTETGEYKVKVGKELTLTATANNATNPVFSWKLDGKIISDHATCAFNGYEAGEYFVTLRVDAENGSAEQQVKVSVMDKLPPEINMAANLVAYQGKDNKLAAIVSYADGAKYAWRLNGTIVSSDSVYIFNPAGLGANTLTLKVWNDDGEDLQSFGLVVLPPPVAELFFDDGHYRLPGDHATRRMSIPLGKSLVLAPVIANIPSPATFQWTVDGVAQSSTTEFLTFTPAAKGNYVVVVSVPAAAVSATVNVECVDPEGTYFRAPTPGSRAIATHAYEFIPAPGQFTSYQQGSTAEQARQDIQNSLDANSTYYIAGLGAYGGYFITGFDHSVSDVTGQADLRIDGNQFQGWSEPGIVWVMQDENGNGLPDDTWYELKGSEAGKPDTHERYAITYFKPTAPGADVLWIDNFGGTGSVDYNQYHSQPYYFPMFIDADSYTLTGTCLKSTMTHGAIDTSPGYAWGYVDNYGDGTKKDFWLEDAIKADGSPANLKYIDFVRVHTGMTGKGAAVGELSTESGAPFDINLNK